MTPPETRPSLLLRLRDGDDSEAWFEFSEIYRPVIVRVAISKGLQVADAEDLCQDVLVCVAQSIPNWRPDGNAKFRTWLHTVTRNAALNAITRARPDRSPGGDTNTELVGRQIAQGISDGVGGAASTAERELFALEARREIFQWAARIVRDEFSDATWQSFWMTAVESIPIDQAAATLQRTRGAVYAARSRVMKRLVETVKEFNEEEEPER